MKISDNSPKCQCIGFIKTFGMLGSNNQLKLGCAFPRNSPGILQGFPEIAFEIWGIWVHSVVSGTNIKHSTDCRGTSKNSIPFSWGTHFCLDFASLYP